MLRAVTIHNFMLIENLELCFEKGLNIITGETGAGKSAILAALSFATGQKAEPSLIRSNASMMSCELVFDAPPKDFPFDEYGLEIDPEEELIIRRELTSEGRSRVFISNRPASLALVKKLCSSLIEFSHQKETLIFSDDAKMLASIDEFGCLGNDLGSFQKAWGLVRTLTAELETCLAQKEAYRLSHEHDLAAFEEIQAAKLIPGEEEALLREFEILTNQEALQECIAAAADPFDDEGGGALRTLASQCSALTKAAKIDPALETLEKNLRTCLAELGEAHHDLLRYRARLESDPARAEAVSARLDTIARLKKKYGSIIAQILDLEQTLRKKIELFEESGFRLEELGERLEQAHREANKTASGLSHKRKEAAKKLSAAVTGALQTLNMSRALFEIELAACNRCLLGDERAEAFLAPNLGEKRIAVRDSASGGELARLLLAFHLVFSRKLCLASLFFDEIDANIGGETAAIIGQKLAHLGSHTQVIAITHFPQVALSASHHIVLYKTEKNGRTCSFAKILSSKEDRKFELLRMVGGKKLELEVATCEVRRSANQNFAQ